MLRSHISGPVSGRRGMVAAQVALCLTALAAVLALLVDGGLLLSERRHAQATADAAALAAASDLYYNWYTNQGADVGGTAKSSALSIGSKNGYTNDGTHSTVTVNIPPQSGNFVNKAGYAEVIVTWNQTRGFSAIYGSGTIPVSARAVAQGRSVSGASGLPGILLLGNSGTTLLGVLNGTVDVTDSKGYAGNGGSIYVDSTGPNAVLMRENANVSAPSVYLAQTGSAPPGVTATGGGVNTGAAQLPDPLSYLPAPNAGNAPAGINVVSLPNGISGSMALTSNTIYIVGGNGVSLNGFDTLTGSNVMLYLTGSKASIDLAGNGAVTLSPMTTGPYAGITLFQARSDTNGARLVGNGNMNITGTIYAPAANVNAEANGTTNVFGSQIIAKSLALTGNGTVNVDFDPDSQVVPATRAFGLVE
jgi:Flp pilus assembly protein TadG